MYVPISPTGGQRPLGEEAYQRGSTEEQLLEHIKKTRREVYQERYGPSHKPRVMLDTNTLMSGIVWPRWPYEILCLTRQGKLELVVCQFSLDKLYRRIQSDFPETFPTLAETLALYPYTQVDDPTGEALAQNIDYMYGPSDIPLALAAIAAQVDFFITEDQDFTAPTPEN